MFFHVGRNIAALWDYFPALRPSMIQRKFGDLGCQAATAKLTGHAGVGHGHDIVVKGVVQHTAMAFEHEFEAMSLGVVFDLVHQLDPMIKSAQSDSIAMMPTAQLPQSPTIGQRTLKGRLDGSTWARSLFELYANEAFDL